jgi:phage terminase large subunit
MKTNRIFHDSLKHYIAKKRIIINKGGTRSSKTYSVLQLIALLAVKSKKKIIISVVSHALPHLKLGAMRDFDNILIGLDIQIEKVKNIAESTYFFENAIVEFFGVDSIAKVHGPQRDVLFVNECNHVKSYDIIRQLMVRTSRTIFFDYNPASEFWIDYEIIGKRDCEVIHSTYLDNKFLSKEQVEEIESNKHNENWWRVYGLGLQGRLEGLIFNNWEYGAFDDSLPFAYGLDFGVKDPDALVKVAVDHKNKKIYAKEVIYENGLSTSQLFGKIEQLVNKDKLIVADSASSRTILDLKSYGLNITGVKKPPIIERIKMLCGYEMVITEDSYSLGKELNSYSWVDKRGEIPIDKDNHAIDAMSYIALTLINAHNNKPKGHRVQYVASKY